MRKILVGVLVLFLFITQINSIALADSGESVIINTENDEASLIRKISNRSAQADSKIFLTSNTTFADSLVGGVLVSEKNSRLFYYEDINSDVDLDMLNSAESISLLGGKDRLNAEEIEKLDNYKERISGSDRYETAVEISKQLGTDRNLIIASGDVFPDALSATALAKVEHRNILLVSKDTLPKTTEAYLREYGIGKNIIFVGGENTISREVKEQVVRIVNPDLNIDAVTLAGKNRYETSLMIANRFKNYKSLVLVDGNNYQKALMSSVLAAKENSPLILADKGRVDISSVLYLTTNAKQVYVFNSIGNIDYDLVKAFHDYYSDGENVIEDLNGQEVHIESLKASESAAESEAIKEEKTETEPADEPKESAEDKKKEEANNNIVMPSGDIINPDNKTITLKDGTVRKYKQIIRMNSTSYDASPESNGPWGPITALGTNLRPGVVAVDPKVIPLKTELYVTSTDEWPSYGMAIAEDTGGAIKGNKIDLFYESSETVHKYGRRDVIVYVLED
ncbi:cell wall-binding repeat-containing protein [Microaceticoccus formicicus]|uniref:cell wall-binding repeat-containing protein n=1 Tax=Microaceticoccus formicicus TaxID=3118105 RepID=UPI003CD010B3|nr:cell wall-binding repeat-containing protein [Peptoniphilaceae bacterium AMB_02]